MKKISVANIITSIRLILAFIVVAISLHAPAPWQLLSVLFIIISILLDGLDGVVARLRNETSVFGAVYDIAVDRITEIVLWVTLAVMSMVSIWIPIIFITRGILVDSLRKPHADQGRLPFSIMQSSLGKFLVASRTMRFTIGLTKLLAFSWLFFLLPLGELWPDLLINNSSLFDYISNILIFASVAICLARGIPVIIEAMIYSKI